MIEFEQIPPKKVDYPVDENVAETREKVLTKLEQKQVENQVKAEAGIIEIPKGTDAIPAELPKYLFKLGANAIQCQRFNLDDDEAKLMAKHISVLTGNINSRWFSFIIILVIVVSKVSGCMEAIRRRFGGKVEHAAIETNTQKVFDEQKKAASNE